MNNVTTITFENLLKGEVKLEALKSVDQENLKRLLKNAQSKKCRAAAMNRQAELETTLKIIDEIQGLITRTSTTKTVDVNNMTLDEVNKAIKNAQSKKCLALAMNRADKAAEAEADENKFKAIKAKMQPSSTVNKVQSMIDELKNMKQTAEVKAQISILEKLL